MRMPPLESLAREYCDEHLLEKARDIQYPIILRAMQIGAEAMGAELVKTLSETKIGIESDRMEANKPR